MYPFKHFLDDTKSHVVKTLRPDLLWIKINIPKGSRPKKKIAYFETLSQRRGEGVQQNLIWKKNLIETQIKGEGGLAKF